MTDAPRFKFAKPEPRRKAREAKRKNHREETAAIREAVFTRAAGSCELCRGMTPAEMHHLEGGSGRRALQSESNCVAICWRCHRDYHRTPLEFLPLVEAWCARHGFPLPRRFRGVAP